MGLCVLSECVARASGGLQPYTAIFKFDPVVGYGYVTGQTVEFSQGPGRYRVAFDEDGVMDRSGTQPEAVVILGDGIIAGLELPRERRLASLVAQKGGTSAVNLAVPGYGLLQEVLSLERWLQTHSKPRVVVVVQNFANDLIDNVPEWEESASIPGIRRGSSSDFELIPPVLPSRAYQYVANLAKTSRLYGTFQSRRSRPPMAGLPSQQMWLYAEKPPREIERGLDALRGSGRRLRAIAEQYRLAVIVFDWVDWPLLWRAVDAPLAKQHLARTRVQQATGFRSHPLEELVPSLPPDVVTWDQRWIIEPNRHANAAAVSAVSDAIVCRLKLTDE
jgi:hypothetical protein